ncbi:MAG TPA: AI-2E family transporter [Bryobacteraceae bacterium]|nr:AI-2E family transporter [Bryobacteraceae bacterium]HOL71731.1 AI-2E family transporter [Bryobacteraceae bacterium]HOQ44447.1 AI-2E family transporter [Bryobacteraceae bacterium]HPQ15271.1 AI-2E family transporter [Bryobacteraceae bacterium]HPU70766.1 AI-2E family transporter [Bryobacteraceae bacterium]
MANGKRFVLLAFALGLLLYVSWVLRNTLLLIYVSAIFAVVLSPAVDWVSRLGIGRWHPGRAISMLLIIGVVLTVTVVFLVLALPPVISDIQQLVEQLPSQLQQLQEYLGTIPFLGQADFETVGRVATSLVGGLKGFVSTTANAVVSIIAVVLLTAYLILDGERTFHWMLSLLPPEVSPRLGQTLVRAARRMRGWLVGQAMLMLILGSASLIAFGLMGVRYYYLLAVFAGVANIIPQLGPILTVIIAGLVAAIDSFAKLLGVVIFYFAYQQVENAFLTPRIMKRQVELSSTAVIVALLIGAELGGIAGALISVPSAVLAAELADEYLVHRPDRQG